MANYFNTAANQQFASLPAAAAAASDIRNQFARTDIARASQADSERRTDLAYQTAAEDQAFRREQIEQVRQAAAQDAEAAKQRMDRQQMMDAAQQRLNIKAVIEGEIAKNGTLSPQTFLALQEFLVAEDPDVGGQAQLMQYSPEAVETMIAGFEGNFGAWFAENPVPMPAPEQPEYSVQDGMYYDKRNPGAGAQPIPGMGQKAEEGFRNATPDEAAEYGAVAGQFGPDGRFYPIYPPKGMEIMSDGRGGFTMREGAGVGSGEKEETISDFTSATSMVANIDAILDDPALDFATGWLEWTQKIPGTGSKRFGTRAAQLKGQAFLQAFEALKGAGQITEMEGAKAEAAVGRLDTAQKAEDYKSALEELRGILVLGIARKNGIIPFENTQPPPAGIDPAAAENWDYLSESERRLFTPKGSDQ